VHCLISRINNVVLPTLFALVQLLKPVAASPDRARLRR
jgi:hypothetical protein